MRSEVPQLSQVDINIYRCRSVMNYPLFSFLVPACNNTIDLVFLVDGSSDVTFNNFRRSLRFVQNLAKVFNLSLPNAHVALVVYAEVSEIIFNLEDHLSYKDVKKAISAVRFPNKRRRNVGKGLKQVKNGVLDSRGRHFVPKIVITLQNRKSEDGIDVISHEFKANGIKVFGVGTTGHRIANGQLKEIAFRPNKDYFKTITYDTIDFGLFVQDMKQSICKGNLSAYSLNLFTFVIFLMVWYGGGGGGGQYVYIVIVCGYA